MKIGKKAGVKATEGELIKRALSAASVLRQYQHGHPIREETLKGLLKAAEEYRAEQHREESGEVPSQAERIAERIKALGYDPTKTPWSVAKQVCESELPGWSLMEVNESDATFDLSFPKTEVGEGSVAEAHRDSQMAERMRSDFCAKRCSRGEHEADELMEKRLGPNEGCLFSIHRKVDIGQRCEMKFSVCKHCGAVFVKEVAKIATPPEFSGQDAKGVREVEEKS